MLLGSGFLPMFASGSSDWWLMPSDSRSFYGGLAQSSFVGNSSVSGGSAGSNGGAGRTFIMSDLSNRILQDGYVRQVVASFATTSPANGVRFKVFRPNGGNYDFISESEAITVSATGTQTYNLTTPMACQAGDIIGVWLSSVLFTQIDVKVGGISRYVAGDITGANVAFPLSVAFTMLIDARGIAPFIATTGDSIAEGHNTASHYHGVQHAGNGPAGNRNAEIAYVLRGLVSTGAALEYQNHALGSQTFAWVASTGAPSAVATSAKAIIVHCGVNDVALARTWAAVEANLNTIKALLNANQRLFIGEILPWTNGSDSQNATIRAWNSSLAAWCAANNATLILCHDAMGQTRVSTGQLDDLLTPYNQDGVHLTQAGVNAMASIWKAALESYF